MAIRLVVLNVMVFIVIRLGDLVCTLSGLDNESWLHFWMMPSTLSDLALYPWTPLVYMFAQFDVLHCLFNLMWLYGFARIFLSFSTPRQLVALYIFSGLSGAIIFIAGMNLLPAMAGTSAWLIGSSAAVMGIVMAAGIIVPDLSLGLLFIGQIKLKWIAVAALVLFVVCGDPSNIGGQMAHIGGALMGVWYGFRVRKGHDITRTFNSVIDKVVNFFRKLGDATNTPRRPKVKPFKKSKRSDNAGSKTSESTRKASRDSLSSDDQAELDAILDKIKKSGYTALTSEEKRRLFDVSKRIR